MTMAGQVQKTSHSEVVGHQQTAACLQYTYAFAPQSEHSTHYNAQQLN